jgi:hypothetical protein
MAFVDKFKVSNTHADEAPFHLNIGESSVYVSPREYVNMYKTLVRNFDSKAYRLTKDIDLDSLSGDQLFEMEKKVRDAIANAFSLTLKNVFVKHNTGGSELSAPCTRVVNIRNGSVDRLFRQHAKLGFIPSFALLGEILLNKTIF